MRSMFVLCFWIEHWFEELESWIQRSGQQWAVSQRKSICRWKQHGQWNRSVCELEGLLTVKIKITTMRDACKRYAREQSSLVSARPLMQSGPTSGCIRAADCEPISAIKKWSGGYVRREKGGNERGRTGAESTIRHKGKDLRLEQAIESEWAVDACWAESHAEHTCTVCVVRFALFLPSILNQVCLFLVQLYLRVKDSVEAQIKSR